MKKLINITLIIWTLNLSALGTDHNEPELLSSFYQGTDGSGADIYGMFAWPSDDGQYLNYIFTLAPVPYTGKFDSNAVQRIFFRPSIVPQLDVDAFIKAGEEQDSEESKFKKFINQFNIGNQFKEVFTKTKAFNKNIISPIVQSASDLFIGGVNGNNLAIDQDKFSEIMISYSKDGSAARLQFKNFHFPHGQKSFTMYVKSNGTAIKQSELSIYTANEAPGLEVFLGGRDDPFFLDIGGFFRSINWRAALDQDDEFVWKGEITRHASADEKESFGRKKSLIDRERKVGVYNAKDIRLGNNVNALVFRMPLNYIVTDRENHKFLRTWAYSYLLKDAYNQIIQK